MADTRPAALQGLKVLVIEDEFMVADDLSRALEGYGAAVIGPAGSVRAALDLIEEASAIDAAVLDINLRGERAFPVADALRDRGVPFLFATGYDAWVIPKPYADVPRLPKPVQMTALVTLLSRRSRTLRRA